MCVYMCVYIHKGWNGHTVFEDLDSAKGGFISPYPGHLLFL